MSQISNKFLAQIPANTLKGNNTGVTGNVSDLSISQVQTMLSIPTASSPLAIGSGGTGQTTAAAAFNALNPMTTTGDLIYESASNVASRLPIGTAGQVLTVVGGIPAWATATTGANTALSNLTTTSINQNLLPNADLTLNLGSNSLHWNSVFAQAVSANANNLSLNGNSVTINSAGVVNILSSSINANSVKINNVTDPTSPQDAATKAYVDAASGTGITALTGDVTATGPGSSVATLATVNGNVGTFGSSTSIPTFTVNAKGLITAASGNAVIAPAGTLSGTTLNATVVSSSLTSLGAQSVALNMNSHQINNVTDPSGPQDAATKFYVDSLAQGLKPKQAVRVGTLANINLASAPASIDGITLASGNRVLVKNQTLPENNGIYDFNGAASAMTRSPDFDSLTPVDEINGAYTFIQEGTQAGQGWVQQGTVTVLGTDPIVFVHFSSTTTVFGGDMITVTGGDTISVDLATVSGLESSNPGNPVGQLRAKVDAATVKINASNQLEGLKPKQQNITLSGTDITNQYVDLAFAVYGASASDNSIVLSVVGGPVQLKAVDYTVSLTGGSGGVTRVTFAGDLATGGNSALIATDILMISYSYLT